MSQFAAGGGGRYLNGAYLVCTSDVTLGIQLLGHSEQFKVPTGFVEGDTLPVAFVVEMQGYLLGTFEMIRVASYQRFRWRASEASPESAARESDGGGVVSPTDPGGGTRG